jgi:molybdopterin adenylyltransferase
MARIIALCKSDQKECHSGCAIYRQIGKCIMPKEGVFARVLRQGFVRAGDEVKVLEG